MGKIGASQISNSSEVFTYKKLNDFSLLLGVGAEYDLSNGISVRASFDLHDKDIQTFKLGLNCNFGQGEYDY